jgi:hypothetical protein
MDRRWISPGSADHGVHETGGTPRNLRRLEIAAGAPKYQGRSNIWSTDVAMRQAERALAKQAELAYRNTVRDWQAAQAKKPAIEVGASATKGHASNKPSKGKAARQTTSP